MKLAIVLTMVIAGSGLAQGPGSPPAQNAPTNSQQQYKQPVPYFSPNPPYTEAGRKNKITGPVRLEITVRKDGAVDPEIIVVRALGYGLDEQAIETVRTWKFRPATIDGKSIDAPLTIDVTFRLL